MWLWLILACGDPEPADADGDGSPAAEDCDDADASVFPGADERCNGVDDDCDGHVDEDDAVDAPTWALDADGDGYGDPNQGARTCEAPEGYVDDFSDCDDDAAWVHPGAREIADGEDEDCDGQVDEGADPFVDEVALAWLQGSGEAGRHLGAADVDGDGLTDALVGANVADEAYVVLGGTPGEVDLDQAWLRLVDGGEGTGSAIHGADLDGDGAVDLIVGAHDLEGRGGGYVLYGPFSGGELSLDQADAELLGTGGGAGHRLTAAGDTDGDGAVEVLVGERKHDGAFTDEGVAWLVAGPPSGRLLLEEHAMASIHGQAEDDRAGRGLWEGADVDGDGLSDIVVAAPRDDTTAENSGLVGLFHGPISGSLLLADADVRYTVEVEDGRLGFDATGSLHADVNGDGHLDLTVGDGEEGSTVYLVYGPFDADLDLSQAPDRVVGEVGEALGLGVRADADLDSDGCDDLLLGAHYGGQGRGAAYVVHGPVEGVVRSQDAAMRIVGQSTDDQLGYAVRWLGDYDGDAVPDLLLGAFGRSGGEAVVVSGASLP